MDREVAIAASELVAAADSLISGDDTNERVLPICTYEHDQSLLRPPRTFRAENGSMVTEPTCVLNALCRGRAGQIRGAYTIGGHSLVSYIMPDEIMEMQTNGVVPAAPRPCVLCARIATDDMLRSSSVPGGPNVINGFTNVGYAESCVNRGAAPDGSAIIGCVTKPCLPALVWRINDDGEPFIDQSALKDQSDFRRGAPPEWTTACAPKS